MKMFCCLPLLLFAATTEAAQISRFRLLLSMVGEMSESNTTLPTLNIENKDNIENWENFGPDTDILNQTELNSFENHDDKLTEKDRQWMSFKREHKKSYFNEAEEKLRRSTFFENKQKIEEHNRRAAAGEETYYQGLNQLADLTELEFQQQYLGGLGDMRFDADEDQLDDEKMTGLPDHWNWNDNGAVVPVKNQGSCGSCWTFSTAGALETLNFRKTKRLVSFSEQQILDCASNRKYGNQGCQGGWPTKAFQYVIDAGGIESTAKYPYLGYQAYCRIYNKPTGGKLRGFVKARPGTEADKKNYIANNGTMSVLVNAGDWQFYRSGVYNHQYCKYSAVNHAVLLVGYTPTYWIIKNSWSRNWGEAGYIKLARNLNMCGVASSAVVPY